MAESSPAHARRKPETLCKQARRAQSGNPLGPPRRDKVEDDALEKTIQKHLDEHLWLLAPSWERATATEYMERRVAAEFSGVDAEMPDEVRNGRVDIKYRTSSGKHVIVELKRSSVTTETADLLGQVDRYRWALRKLLEEAGDSNPSIETGCVVGKPLRDWSGPDGRRESANALHAKHIRVMTYSGLIGNAARAYQAYIDESRKARHIIQILDRIDEEVATGS